ncbi:hypothetical protein H632_c728p0 [Helicosporidium sp. ATCC 50920]|nr:hypothetical protein H632_c728p0 [Helicosporidium sp. ATCC 50920]|eukprot:KDD75350.1 hypothetical protein H632_c728p0 [Helicosporidium sp. ATCC 50920]
MEELAGIGYGPLFHLVCWLVTHVAAWAARSWVECMLLAACRDPAFRTHWISSGDSPPLFERFIVQSTSITNGRAAKTIKAVPVISQTSIGQASRKKAMLKGTAADDIVSHEIGFGSTMDRLHSEIARLEKELRLTQQQNKELAERLMEAAFSSTEPAIETSPQRPSSPDPMHAGLIRSELTEEGQHSRRRKLPLSQLSDLVAAGL